MHQFKEQNVDKTFRLQAVRMLVNWSEHYDSTTLTGCLSITINMTNTVHVMSHGSEVTWCVWLTEKLPTLELNKKSNTSARGWRQKPESPKNHYLERLLETSIIGGVTGHMAELFRTSASNKPADFYN